MTYDDLLLNVKEFANRGDVLDGVLSTLIKWGQEALEDELRIPDMEYTPADNPYLAKGTNKILIPSDHLELKALTFTDQLPAPVNAAFTSGAGSLGAGTYYYRVSALNQQGETLGSVETSIVLGAPGGVNVNWAKVDGATGYRVYGRTTGAQQLIASLGDVATYLDGGAITPAGALPAENTTGTTRYEPVERLGNDIHGDLYRSVSKGYTGRPVSCKRVGDYLYFDRYADKDYVYEWTYYRRLAALSEAAPTNWWSLNAEKALLYSTLVEATGYLQDEPNEEKWEARMKQAIEKLRSNKHREQGSGNARAQRSINVF